MLMLVALDILGFWLELSEKNTFISVMEKIQQYLEYSRQYLKENTVLYVLDTHPSTNTPIHTEAGLLEIYSGITYKMNGSRLGDQDNNMLI